MSDLIIKLVFSICIVVFFLGISAALVRQSVMWIILSFITSIKALIVAALLAAIYGGSNSEVSEMLVFILCLLLPVFLLSGLSAQLRTRRFGAKADLMQEDEIKN